MEVKGKRGSFAEKLRQRRENLQNERLKLDKAMKYIKEQLKDLEAEKKEYRNIIKTLTSDDFDSISADFRGYSEKMPITTSYLDGKTEIINKLIEFLSKERKSRANSEMKSELNELLSSISITLKPKETEVAQLEEKSKKYHKLVIESHAEKEKILRKAVDLHAEVNGRLSTLRSKLAKNATNERMAQIMKGGMDDSAKSLKKAEEELCDLQKRVDRLNELFQKKQQEILNAQSKINCFILRKIQKRQQLILTADTSEDRYLIEAAKRGAELDALERSISDREEKLFAESQRSLREFEEARDALHSCIKSISDKNEQLEARKPTSSGHLSEFLQEKKAELILLGRKLAKKAIAPLDSEKMAYNVEFELRRREGQTQIDQMEINLKLEELQLEGERLASLREAGKFLACDGGAQGNSED